jgi:hypothetical protein
VAVQVIWKLCNSKYLPYTELMAVNFTQHALTRMLERCISREEVLATLAQPLMVVLAQGD